MQRDVEIEVFDVDKSGGFIGALYINKTENAAVTMAKEGLATVHSYSADGLPWAKTLYDAEVGDTIPALCHCTETVIRRQKLRQRSGMCVFYHCRRHAMLTRS